MPRKYEVHLDLDTRCNYKCKYCYLSEYPNHPRNSIDFDIIKETFKKLNNHCWSIYLSCAGEPLMHPDFNKILDYIKTQNPTSDITLVTNGSLLTEKIQKKIINSGITRVLISIDTIQKDLYSSLCGCNENTLEKVLSQTTNLIKLRGKNKFPKVSIVSIIMKSTIEYLHQIATWSAKNGIDGIRLQWLIPVSSNMNNELLKPDSYSLKYLNKFKNICKKNNIVYEAPNNVTTNKLFSVLESRKLYKNKLEYFLFNFHKFISSLNKKSCRHAGLSLGLSTKGELTICTNSTYSLCNLIKTPQNKISKELKKKIKEFDSGTWNECKTCNMNTSKE